jgi:hypothetical protein
MPKIEVPEEQILDSLAELSPASRREALRRLLPTAAYIERAVSQNEPRVRALAQERGVDWNALSDAERLEFVDRLLHE